MFEFLFNRIRSLPRVYRALMRVVDQLPWLRNALRSVVNRATVPVPDIDKSDPFLEARFSSKPLPNQSHLTIDNSLFLSAGYPALLGVDKRPYSSAFLLLVDVSSIIRFDPETGIQRVVVRLLQEMMFLSATEFRVEPVYEYQGRYYFARRFTHEILGLALDKWDRAWRPDSLVVPTKGDVFLGLDWAQFMVQEAEHTLKDWKNRGVSLHFVVYDILPLQLPQYFPRRFDREMEAWVVRIAGLGDSLQCISASVAEDLNRFLADSAVVSTKPVVQVFPLAADFEVDGSLEASAADELVFVNDNRVTCLMVGFLHPRKGHAQALEAFEQLWCDGVPVRLVIVGSPGGIDARLSSRLRRHPQAKGESPSLVWLESATDEQLVSLYRNSDFLLAASEGEGFGLPLIEASLYGLPVLARDLSVFREVLGDQASYFTGLKPADLSLAIRRFIAALREGRVMPSIPERYCSWRTSARILTSNILPSWDAYEIDTELPVSRE